MGQVIEMVSGLVTNPGGAVTAIAPVAGNSFTIRSFAAGSKCDIVELWGGNATGGVGRIMSPRMHDNVQGFRFQIPAGNSLEYLPRRLKIPVESVDTLNIAMSGGGAEVDVLSFLLRYSNLDGGSSVLKTWQEIQDRIVSVCGVEMDLVSGATAGQWGGQRTLNQDFQNLKADKTYAILGYTCASAFASLGVTGPDTSNYRLGGPGTTNTDVTADWFVRLGIEDGFPTIPVVKSNNQGGTIIDLLSTDTATAHHVSLTMALLD